MTASSKPPPAPFAEAWSLPLESGSYANVLASDRRVFVGDDRLVAAHDSGTGRRLWAYPVPGRLVAADTRGLVVAVGNREWHVLDADTGQPGLAFWGALGTSVRTEPGTRSAARVGSHLVVFGTHDAHDRLMLRAVDTESGQRLWTHSPDVWALGIAATETRVVMVPSQGKVRAFEMASGRPCWEYACQPVGPPRVDERRAFVACSGSSSISTVALDLETGRPEWKISRQLAWAGEGKVYALSADRSRIEAGDAATGRRDRDADLAIELPPSLRQHTATSILLMSEAHVFVTGLRDASAGRRSLLCLDRVTGQVWGHLTADVGEVYPPVLTAAGLCYRTSARVYGLRRVPG